ncbi:Uncharacterised protein [Burkholderia pseudomallei]|nr:Uncharacterised protein [Burkholderia pseudomallei]
MMPTFTGAVTVRPSGVVAVTFFVRIVYGVKRGAFVFALITFASTCGKSGPAHFFCRAGSGRPSTANALPVTCDRYGSP